MNAIAFLLTPEIVGLKCCCNCQNFEKEKCPVDERYWLFHDNDKHVCDMFEPVNDTYVCVCCD